eukprot:5770548-Amphidinium_carterae.2
MSSEQCAVYAASTDYSPVRQENICVSGNDEDWHGRNFQFLGYVGLVSQTMYKQMKVVSRIPQPLHAIDALEDTLATQSRSLYFLLTQLVSGRAFVILRAVPDQHVYESWRRLCAQYEPTTNTGTAGVLKALISPDFKNDSLESWKFFWLQWLQFCYERAS